MHFTEVLVSSSGALYLNSRPGALCLEVRGRHVGGVISWGRHDQLSGENIAIRLKIGLLLCWSIVLLVFVENSFVFRT